MAVGPPLLRDTNPDHRDPSGKDSLAPRRGGGQGFDLPFAVYVYTITSVDIAFDPAKDRLNIANHGVSLALAADLEWDLLLASEDVREAYGEQRWVGFAPIGQLIYCVVFTEENDCYRIISLRGTTNSEKRTYIHHL